MTELKTVSYSTDLKTLSRRMIDEKVPSFLVEKDGFIIGTVTYEDLLRVLIKLLDQPEKHVLFENIQKWFYETPVGEIVNTLAQAGI